MRWLSFIVGLTLLSVVSHVQCATFTWYDTPVTNCSNVPKSNPPISLQGTFANFTYTNGTSWAYCYDIPGSSASVSVDCGNSGSGNMYIQIYTSSKCSAQVASSGEDFSMVIPLINQTSACYDTTMAPDNNVCLVLPDSPDQTQTCDLTQNIAIQINCDPKSTLPALPAVPVPPTNAPTKPKPTKTPTKAPNKSGAMASGPMVGLLCMVVCAVMKLMA